jgi:hypothetical protein
MIPISMMPSGSPIGDLDRSQVRDRHRCPQPSPDPIVARPSFAPGGERHMKVKLNRAGAKMFAAGAAGFA